MQYAGYGFVFLAAFLWGLIGPVAKFAMADGAGPLEIAFYRAAIGAAFFLVHCLVRRTGRIARKDVPAFMIFGVVGVAVFFGSYQIAVREGGAALASILLYTAPAWVALLSKVFLAEALTPKKMFALVMAMSGAACVSLGAGGGLGHSVSALGIICGLISGLTYALHYVFGKKYLGDYDSATLYLWILPVGSVVLAPFVDFSPLTQLSTQAWATFFFLGLFTTYGAYMAYLAGLKRLAATRVAVTANLEPVIAAIMAWVWWGEFFTPLGYAGGLLVLGAVLVMVFADKSGSHS